MWKQTVRKLLHYHIVQYGWTITRIAYVVFAFLIFILLIGKFGSNSVFLGLILESNTSTLVFKVPTVRNVHMFVSSLLNISLCCCWTAFVRYAFGYTLKTNVVSSTSTLRKYLKFFTRDASCKSNDGLLTKSVSTPNYDISVFVVENQTTKHLFPTSGSRFVIDA